MHSIAREKLPFTYLFQHQGRVVCQKAVARETMMLASELKKIIWWTS